MANSMRTFSENADLVLERREHVRKCATSLFVKKPFEKASLEEILQATDMSKGGLYYYVGSKEDIRYLITNHASKAYIEIHHSLIKTIEKLSAVDAIREVIRGLCQWMNDYQDEVIVLIHEMGNLSKEERQPLLNSDVANIDLFKDIIREGIRTGEFKQVDIEVVAHTILLGIRAWAERRWYLKKLYTMEQYVDSLSAFAISALKNNNGIKSQIRK